MAIHTKQHFIAGLDMATKTGWAILNIQTRKIIESGVQDFTKKRGESNGLLFLKFRTWLVNLIRESRLLLGGDAEIPIIAYEQAHFRGGAATEICVGLQTRAQEIAAEFLIESAPVKTNTLKKFWTGSGVAGKRAMMEKSAQILGRPAVDDNEADAVAVAFWAAHEYYPNTDGGGCI